MPLDAAIHRTYVLVVRMRLGGIRRAGRITLPSHPTPSAAGRPTIGHVKDARTERAALVALLRLSGIKWSDAVLQVLESGSAVSVLDRAIGSTDTLFPGDARVAQVVTDAVAEIAEWEADGIGVHAFFEDSYPAQLRGIREMPPLLFTRGEVRTDTRAIAVVGTRNASADGLRIARAVATSLAHREITVVSGLAKGIDTAAHQAALKAGGRTVAVVGTGIRRYYPPGNRDLQDHIARVGLVVSQFWPDAPPTRQTFPMRNAVMSGYAAATVVIEAGWKSGARIQARLALQHGRHVILTDRVLQHEWARSFAENPGVYVVRGTAELLDAVEDILADMPTDEGLESFPDPVTL